MLIRKHQDSIAIIGSLEPATEVPCCLALCSAPSCCPVLGLCCCCLGSSYIEAKRSASKYILLREHSLEWNEPNIVLSQGSCCGIDPYADLESLALITIVIRCMYDIRDHVQVIYYDDPLFDRISDQTPVCNELRTCLFGGKGERIQIESPCCFGCNRATFSSIPCICVPQWCPTWIPCTHKYVIYVENAQKGIYEINKARNSSKSDPSRVLEQQNTMKVV